jgi:hypothetical protein
MQGLLGEHAPGELQQKSLGRCRAVHAEVNYQPVRIPSPLSPADNLLSPVVRPYFLLHHMRHQPDTRHLCFLPVHPFSLMVKLLCGEVGYVELQDSTGDSSSATKLTDLPSPGLQGPAASEETPHTMPRQPPVLAAAFEEVAWQPLRSPPPARQLPASPNFAIVYAFLGSLFDPVSN